MFGGSKIKLDDDLVAKLKLVAEAGGYESVEEFVVHVLEREVSKLLPSNDADTRDAVRKRLQGLGYIE